MNQAKRAKRSKAKKKAGNIRRNNSIHIKVNDTASQRAAKEQRKLERK